MQGISDNNPICVIVSYFSAEVKCPPAISPAKIKKQTEEFSGNFSVCQPFRTWASPSVVKSMMPVSLVSSVSITVWTKSSILS